MNVTPIYQLGYFVPNLSTASNLDLDKNRFITIENQLYNVYNIFGNGIAPVYDNMGAQLNSWTISVVPNEQAVQISSGKGHINYTYAETSNPVQINLSLPLNAITGTYRFYFYAIETDTTPVDKTVNFISSLTQIVDPVNYIGLGAADLVIDTAAGTFTLTVYNDSAHGRQVISVLASLSDLVKNHLHVGGSNEPSPIDLGAHVTGFLSSNNIDYIDANKISTGTLDPNRLPLIDHNSLLNIGTLTHQQIDSLLAALQSPDATYQLSNYGIVNRLQLILALKKQSGFFNIDGEQWNVILYMPYTQLAGFVDTSLINNKPVTTATIDTTAHRVYGVTGIARQSYVIKVNSTQDFFTALFTAQDSIPNPLVTTNVTVTGVNSTPIAGTINNPYGVTGSATSIYVSSFQDSFISQFTPQGNFVQRKINFDPNLNLNTPLALHYDSGSDNLYIADTLNNRIIVTDGSLINNKAQIGYNGGRGQQGNDQGGFAFPKGVYGLGNTFYVSDSGNNQIQKFYWPSGQAPYWVATYKYANSGSTIQNIYQPLSDPRGIIATTINSNNYLFISDYGNHRVLIGIETYTNNIPALNITQILGANSAGFNIYNTSLLSYSSNSVGVGAQFGFSTSVNGTISTILVTNAGTGYSTNDQFNLTYNGQSAGYFLINTDGTGHVTQAYVSNGISTSDLKGFSHPQGLAFTNKGNLLDLLIVDTDNNRVINYTAPSGIGYGVTNNKFLAQYSFGIAGITSDTSSAIYFERPANIFAQPGFTTAFVSDSLNNRIHSISTSVSFSNSNGLGFTAFTFGVADTSLTSGGVTLSKPDSYLSVASAWNLSNKPSTWTYGIYQSVTAGIEGGRTDKYNFIYNSYPAFQYEDKIAVAISTLDENFITGATLGDIYCYLIFDNNSANGNLINFNLTPSGSSLNSIRISTIQPLRSLVSNGTYASGPTSVAKIFNLSAFTGQNGGVQPQIFGFGFLWSTQYGWLNNDQFGLEFILPPFPSNTLYTSYPKVLEYQQTNALTNDSIFAFNANQYATSGYFVFRYDAGPGGAAIFDYAIFEYSTPASANGQAKITFNYRTADNIGDLNSNGNWQNYGYDVAIGIVSGEALSINKQARYIDLIFYLQSSADRFEPPTISSISLFFNVNGIANGIIYDTNVNNSSVTTYPRFKWSQGNSSNIEILPVDNDNTQSYQIQIADTTKINNYFYLSTDSLKFGNSDFSSFLDINNNYYLSPYQNFIGSAPALLNPQHYISNGAGGYFIADTDNDRVLEVDSNGQFLSAIQGNIKLCRLDRDFVILGVYYNPTTMQIYALFSQYLAFAANYIQYLSVKIDGVNYPLSDPTYFKYLSDGSILAGLYKINANSQSATFYATVTPAMDLIIKAGGPCYFQIDQSSVIPFTLANPRSDSFASDAETFTYTTTSFNEFQYNSLFGIGTILDYQPNVTIVSSDPTVFANNTSTPSTVLWSYYPSPNYASSYSVLITVGNIFVDNIFKPIHVDYTDAGSLIISTVGNNSIRAYDSSFNSLYTIGQSNFVFNEKLGGSTVVLDRGFNQPGNSLLIAQPSIDYSTSNPSIGLNTSPSYIYVYNRNKNYFINKFEFNSTVAKAIPDSNEYVAILYDWAGLGLRSKLVRIKPDSTTDFVLNNVLNKPVSLNSQLNGKYYVTDTTGQLGNIFFRKFISDGSGNTIGVANTGSGSGNSSGGNTSGNPTGGNNFNGGTSTGGKLPGSGGSGGGNNGGTPGGA